MTSIPSSTQYWTAARNESGAFWLKLPVQPMPAATMSGVVPSTVAILGSAPASTSSRIAPTSLDIAARQNGVPPAWFVQLRSWDEGLNQIFRARRTFGSAPRSSRA